MRLMYTKKSMKTEQECFEYLAKISTPQLSENDKVFCECKLTLQNIWEALNSMKNGKPGGGALECNLTGGAHFLTLFKPGFFGFL